MCNFVLFYICLFFYYRVYDKNKVVFFIMLQVPPKCLKLELKLLRLRLINQPPKRKKIR